MQRLSASARITVVLRSGLQVPRAACITRPSVSYSSTGRRLGSTAAAAASRSSRSEAQKAPTQDRARSKVFKDADEAVADIKSGSTILSAGFGLCGVAGT